MPTDKAGLRMASLSSHQRHQVLGWNECHSEIEMILQECINALAGRVYELLYLTWKCSRRFHGLEISKMAPYNSIDHGRRERNVFHCRITNALSRGYDLLSEEFR